VGRKIEVQETKQKFQIFASNFCAPVKGQSCAHGTCHACHTLDTPLASCASRTPTTTYKGLNHIHALPSHVKNGVVDVNLLLLVHLFSQDVQSDVCSCSANASAKK